MTPAGIEYLDISSNGTLLVRETNIRWLIERFRRDGFVVEKNLSGQFTELHTRVSFKLLKSLLHGFNYFCFRHINIPYFTFGNILILKSPLKLCSLFGHSSKSMNYYAGVNSLR